MAYRTLTLETKGSIAWLRLARPERGNPIDRAFLQELDQACAAINDNPEVRVAVLTAEGEVFSSGWDPAELSPEAFGASASLSAGPAEWRQSAFGGSPPFAGLESMGQPAICV